MEEAVRLILALWTERRATFHGRYFHAEDAILEPKPVQKPRPPVLIAGGSEQLTLRAVARLGDACNVGGDPETVRRKLGILRGHCDTAQRDYAAIEKTHNTAGCLLATRPQSRRSASVCRGAVRCAALSAPCLKPLI